MFQKIERDNGIFKSDLFQKDAMAFSIIESILNNPKKYPTPKIFSNALDCAVVNSDSEHAVIVWTADSFQEREKLYDFIKKEFHKNTPFKIMAKKDFYDFLLENNKIPKLPIQTLGVYSCQKLNAVQYVGHPDWAKTEEVPQIAEMLVNFGKETGEGPNLTLTDCIPKALEYVSNPTNYVWRNKDEKIVAIASDRGNDEAYSRIGCVYTKRTERGKSYAKMLVHYLTSQLLNSGKKPMLFTDYDYQPSNRCYQAIGYELNCTIVNFVPPHSNHINEAMREYQGR